MRFFHIIMMFSNTFLASANRISQRCRNPGRVLEAMRHTMGQTTKLQNACYVADLLGDLTRKRLPLPSVEGLCAKLCMKLPERRTTTLVNTVMKWKVKDAWTLLGRRNTTTQRFGEGVVRAFNNIWRKEKRRHWLYLRKKRTRRVNFLSEKFGSRNACDCVTEVEGIVVVDQPLPSTFSSNPRCYGGVQLTGDEEKVLGLPPKFAVYDRVDLTSCEAQIEKGLAKLRWSALRGTDAEPGDEREEQLEKDRERIWPFDLKKGAFDLRYLRPTDLPFNKRVCLPDALENGEEIDLQHLKGRLVSVTKDFINEQNMRPTKINLTHEEQRGLRSLKGREDVVVYQTDKSERFAVDTKDNYRVACQPHVENDHTVTESLHERLQKEANAHSVLWVRLLNAGEVVGGQARIKNNMLVSDCTLAPLYTLRKDHKKTADQNSRPPVRPVCGAVSAYNRNLAHLISMILTEVWKKEESVCLNTEEMLADFRKVNSNNITEEVIIGSADVKGSVPQSGHPFYSREGV